MGKTSRFFLSLFGFKNNDPPTSRGEHNKQLKRRWSFVKSRRGNSSLPRIRETSNSLDLTSFHHHECNLYENEDPNKHAIELAAATTAVVDAAVAAAHASKEVVRMISASSSRTTGYSGRDKLAAIKIQSCFRAYLARRALRALKALVRLQAVVRGHILRKQTADMMRRLQALVRAQARARALRSQFYDPTTNYNNKPISHFYHHGPPTPEKFEHLPHTKHDHRPIFKRNSSKTYDRGIMNDKIVEVDIVRRKLYQPDQVSFGYSHSISTSRGSTFQPTSSSPCASCEVNSFDDSIRGVSKPIKSDGPRSCISGYSDHPNYMAYTESSRAKVRSLSAPRLRSQFEISSNSTKTDFGYKYGSGMPRVPTIKDSFAKKAAYSGSGRLDRLGIPVYDMEESEFCVSYWN
uniref:protein IQ-DOMAIN 22 n=1 Tax=Erigeron canadensis TaxID=72917 RepID=UPI001CB952FF|nr:protein IQ-DOMAIN 22 [Erigeron canadensis]